MPIRRAQPLRTLLSNIFNPIHPREKRLCSCLSTTLALTQRFDSTNTVTTLYAVFTTRRLFSPGKGVVHSAATLRRISRHSKSPESQVGDCNEDFVRRPCSLRKNREAVQQYKAVLPASTLSGCILIAFPKLLECVTSQFLLLARRRIPEATSGCNASHLQTTSLDTGLGRSSGSIAFLRPPASDISKRQISGI